MIVQFVTHDLEWTDAMKAFVEDKLSRSPSRHIFDKGQIAVHIAYLRESLQVGNRRPCFEMWVRLKTHGGSASTLVRREGYHFRTLVALVVSELAEIDFSEEQLMRVGE